MSTSSDAAEQVIRISIEGMSFAVKLVGAAAKELALIIIAALKSKDGKVKLTGQARMKSMIKAGKALEIFSVKESDLKTFMQGAKQYGVVYCVLRNKRGLKDGVCDIMVKAEDSHRISRMINRLKLATVDRATVERTELPERGDRPDMKMDDAELMGEINDVDTLLDDFLGVEAPEVDEPDFFTEVAAKENPSGNFLGSENTSEREDSDKPSVKEQLREIRAARKPEEEKAAPVQPERAADKAGDAKPIVHIQPKANKTKELIK